jgi:hypothetical protein
MFVIWFGFRSSLIERLPFFPVDGAVTARDIAIASSYRREVVVGNYGADSVQSECQIMTDSQEAEENLAAEGHKFKIQIKIFCKIHRSARATFRPANSSPRDVYISGFVFLPGLHSDQLIMTVLHSGGGVRLPAIARERKDFGITTKLWNEVLILRRFNA